VAASLKGQIRYAFRKARAFGRSRHADKHAKQARGRVYSPESEKKLIQRCIMVVNWIRDRHQFTILAEIKREWVKKVFLELIEGKIRTPDGRPYSVAAIHNFASAMRKLQRLCRTTYPGYKFHFMDGLEQSRSLGIKPRSLAERRGVNAAGERALSKQEAEAIVAWISQQGGKGKLVAEVLAVQLKHGLRLSKELLEADFEIRQGAVWVKGKGGRWRKTDLTANEVRRIDWLRKNVAARTVQRWVARAVAALGLRSESPGSHAFRGAFAQEVFRQELATGATPREARLRLARRLGHNRRSSTYYYVRGQAGRRVGFAAKEPEEEEEGSGVHRAGQVRGLAAREEPPVLPKSDRP